MIKFKFCKTKDSFEQKLEEGSVDTDHIVFIEDTGEIYTRGRYWTKDLVISREIVSDSSGMITIENIDGYDFLEAVAYNAGQPLNVIRFGDNLYVGYYGGGSLPSTSSPVDLLFTSIANQTVKIYYILSN